MPSYKARELGVVSEEWVGELVIPLAAKFSWFLSKGYVPHTFQTLFHTMQRGDRLCRFRHLVAGRRGGKTLAAAWELLFYLLHPEQFHIDMHGAANSRPLHAWVLTKDYPAGLPALMTFREVVAQAGVTGLMKENRGHRWFEFDNGSFLQFKTADEPDSLRGAGLDLLWMDEAAFIPNENAYNVVRPALSDKLGCVISTTTPSGKNWFYDEFWSDEAKQDTNIGRVEYWSLDNPYFPAEEWEYMRKKYHPLLFKQEYCAAFDSMAGKELSGDWLHYYTLKDLDEHKVDGKIKLKYYIGVDPAVSLADTADRFSMAVLGVTTDNSQVYLISQFAGRIPFPEQVDLIAQWNQTWKPEFIGIESTAYQAALYQQVSRLNSLPPVTAIFRRGKKAQHILAMSPLFKIGKIRIRKEHRDFIDEWLDYDSELKNPKDDCLDAVELALRTAGALHPEIAEVSYGPDFSKPAGSLEEIRTRDMFRRKTKPADETLGSEW